MMRWGVWDWRGRVCRDKAAQTSSGRMAARRGQRRSDVALARGSTGLELRVGDVANNPADSLNCRRTGSVGSGWPGAMRDAGSVEATRSVAAFPSPLSGLRSNEVRHPGFRLTASPWANIQRRFAACARYGLAARGPGGIPGPPRTEHPACCGRRARHAVPLHGALRDLTISRNALFWRGHRAGYAPTPITVAGPRGTFTRFPILSLPIQALRTGCAGRVHLGPLPYGHGSVHGREHRMRTVKPSDSAVHPGRYQLLILKVKVNRAVTVRERSEMDPDVTSKGG